MNEVKRSQGTKKAVTEFLTELSNYLSNSEITRLGFGKLTLDETDLPYKPEAFVRHNLVHLLLDAANLEYQIEPVSETHRKTWADFDITNTDIPFIGEVKPINAIQGGEQEVLSYLGEDGFNTPYGILTDGIEWRFYGPRIGHKPGYTCLKTLNLENCLLLSWKDFNTTDLSALSENKLQSGIEQAEDFGEFVGEDRLDTWALERLPKEIREEYQSEGQSLQASLSGYWSEL